MNLKAALVSLSKKAYFWPLLLLILTMPAIKDLLMPGFFPMHDDFQIMRTVGMNQCFSDLQIPCRWIPDAGFGFGYPMFNYYPPFPYYLGQIFQVTGLDVFSIVKLNFLFTFLLSGGFMFILARRFFGNLGGLLAAVFYVYAPYHSVDIYVRGALNEAWGLVWFPLIFYATHRIIDNAVNDTKSNLILALSYAGLLLSHNVMTLIFTPLMALWIFFWLLKTKKLSRLFPLLLSGVWAVGLAAFFFLPVIFESKLVHVETMTVGYFNYLAHFADIKQMFLSRFWGYGASTWGPEDDMAFPIGHFQWIIGGVLVGASSLLIFLKSLFKKPVKLTLKLPPILTLLLLFSSLFYTFLIHSRSVWFWDNLPLLYFAQFPWRLLAIPAFLFSFLSGALIPQLKFLGRYLTPFTIALIIGAIGWNISFFRAESRYPITQAEKFSGRLWENQTTGGIFDYLPKSAARPPGEPSPIYPTIIDGSAGIRNFVSRSNSFSFTADVSTSSSIMLPIYDYPIWEITSNNQSIVHTHEPDLGRVMITLPTGTQTVTGKLTDTPIRKLGNLITLFSILFVLFSLKKRSPNQLT